MSDKSKSWRQCLIVLIFGVTIHLLTAVPIPGDPMETIGLGAMTLAGNAAEVFQNGAALRHAGNIETPIFSMNKKTELGFGEAIRKKSQNEDSEEYRKKRRRRATKIINAHNMDKSQVSALISTMPDIRRAIFDIYHMERAPCRRQTPPSGGGGGGENDGDVEEVERLRALPQRRNALQRQQTSKSTGNNQSQRKTNNSTAKKFISGQIRRRRRRQAEMEFEEFTNVGGNDTQKQFSEQAKEFTEQLRNTLNGVVDTMATLVQNLRKAFEGEDNPITKPST